MKVAIAGAGVAGRYLYRLASMEKGVVKDAEIDIYDIGNPTCCKINPCAWMVPQRLFGEMLKLVELNPESYVMKKFDKFKLENQTFTAVLQVINKPQLLKDLLDDYEVLPIAGTPKIEDYDRIIDCTGTARAHLPIMNCTTNSTNISCVQIRGEVCEGALPYPMIKFVKLGYAWAIPLGYGLFDNTVQQCHVGCGSLTGSPMEELEKTGFLDVIEQNLCGCVTGNVRLSGPRLSTPFTFTNQEGKQIWGCGESIGCVSPVIGEGIVPAMECACRLVENWNSADNYTNAVNRQFEWMDQESMLMQRLLHGDKLGFQDALILASNAARIDMKIGATEALNFIKLIICNTP